MFLLLTKLETRSDGQSLIETLAALFILVTGVSAAVGLAVYALNSSTGILKEIVATGLAREGLEAVRNMRDTNWLKDSVDIDGCHDFVSGSPNQDNCYKNWLGDQNMTIVPFCINPSNGNPSKCLGNAATKNYALGFNYTSANFWNLIRQDGSDKNYGLNFDGQNSGNSGFYSPGSGITCATASGKAEYCRKIIITKLTSAPYDQDTGPLVKVQSRVWWVDKKCPRISDWDEVASPQPLIPPVSCRVELDSYLTNWKNY